jgi:hypothetical protein
LSECDLRSAAKEHTVTVLLASAWRSGPGCLPCGGGAGFCACGRICLTRLTIGSTSNGQIRIDAFEGQVPSVGRVRLGALADGFVEDYGRRDGGVEGVGGAEHGDADFEFAGRQPLIGQAQLLGADEHSQWAGEVGVAVQ